MTLSILSRQSRLKFMLAEARELRITGFPSPAEDDKERPLSLDRLINLGAPHIWPFQVDDDSLIGFGMYRGNLIFVDRSRDAEPDTFLVVDLEGTYVIRLVERNGHRLILRPPQNEAPSIPLEGVEVFGMVIGGYWKGCPG